MPNPPLRLDEFTDAGFFPPPMPGFFPTPPTRVLSVSPPCSTFYSVGGDGKGTGGGAWDKGRIHGKGTEALAAWATRGRAAGCFFLSRLSGRCL